jgi:hypothetical protein
MKETTLISTFLLPFIDVLEGRDSSVFMAEEMNHSSTLKTGASEFSETSINFH